MHFDRFQKRYKTAGKAQGTERRRTDRVAAWVTRELLCRSRMTDALTTFVSSTLGNQWVSSRQSAPSYGFGTSTREHAAKVFISPKHAELSTMPLSPSQVRQ